MTDLPRAPAAETLGRGRPAGRILLALASGVLLVALLDLALGSVSIPPGEVLAALFGGDVQQSSWSVIVRQIRLPRVLTAAVAGAALAVSGLLMQTLFRNPLAGPYVLGISSGASLGVALVVLGTGGGIVASLGVLGSAGRVLAATAGASAVLVLVLVAARRVGMLTLLILGVLVGYATGALVTVLIHFSAAERIQAYLVWTFGSFGNVDWGQLQVLAPVTLTALAASLLLAKPLNALQLGAAYAKSLGLAVGRARLAVLVTTAVLAGAVTAFCGPVGFLGVAVPHLARGLLHTADHRLLLPATALAGALVALTADLVAQMPGRAQVLPLNAVTALIGAPVIAALVLRRRGFEGSFR